MICDPQTLLNPPYAADTTASLTSWLAWMPLSCPTSRNAKSEPYTRFSGGPLTRALACRAEMDATFSGSQSSGDPEASSSTMLRRSLSSRTPRSIITISRSERCESADAVAAADGPEPMMSAVGTLAPVATLDAHDRDSDRESVERGSSG